MSAIKDQYDFTRPSTSGRAGFESFADAANGHYFFHFNDENGQPLLFSQAYQSPEKRDNGIESVEKNRVIAGRVQGLAVVDGFVVVVKAGNNQEVARSRPYSSDELSLSARKTIQNLRFDAENAQKVEKMPVENAAPDAPPAEKIVEKAVENVAENPPAALKTDHSARHIFKISLYQTGENEPFQGKIEHAVTNEKAIFTGNDFGAIGAFLQKTVPTLTAAAAEKSSEIAPVLAQKIEAAPKTVELPPVLENKSAILPEILENKPPLVEKSENQPVSFQIKETNYATKTGRKMRVLAVAKFDFAGMETEDEADAAPQISTKKMENAPVEIEEMPVFLPKITSAQTIISPAFRPKSEENLPLLSHKTTVVIAPPKTSEPSKSTFTKLNFEILPPNLPNKPKTVDISTHKIIERIIDPGGSGQTTVTSSMPIAEKLVLPIAPKFKPPTFGHFYDELLPVLPEKPLIARILSPGEAPKMPPMAKKIVHYAG